MTLLLALYNTALQRRKKRRHACRCYCAVYVLLMQCGRDRAATLWPEQMLARRCCLSLSVKSPSSQLVLGSTLVKHSTNHVQVQTIFLLLLLSTDEPVSGEPVIISAKMKRESL